MIRTQEMVPDYYVEKSRDFQILCRLYDFTFNSLKFNIDTMQSLTDTRSVKETVLPLVGDKFGVYEKEAYTNRQLLDALPVASKYKGSMKAVKILVNAFLDSMELFQYALILHSKDEASAQEIGESLKRKIKPYSLVIIFSTFPSLANLKVLNVYLNKVLPSGLTVEYAFGTSSDIIDTFKYKEYAFMLYTHVKEYPEEGVTLPYIGFVKNKADKYSATFEYAGTDNISSIREYIKTTSTHWIPRYTPVSVPPAVEVFVYHVVIDPDTQEQVITRIYPNVAGEYTVTAGAYVEYHYNKTREFIEEQLSDIDVNAVGLATVQGRVED